MGDVGKLLQSTILCGSSAGELVVKVRIRKLHELLHDVFTHKAIFLALSACLSDNSYDSSAAGGNRELRCQQRGVDISLNPNTARPPNAVGIMFVRPSFNFNGHVIHFIKPSFLNFSMYSSSSTTSAEMMPNMGRSKAAFASADSFDEKWYAFPMSLKPRAF